MTLAYLLKGVVSIHAPTWGATTNELITLIGKEVSIHAPTWGATHKSERKQSEDCFNPRSHMGSDSTMARDKHNVQFQSTLPHGERRRFWSVILVTPGFNPRSHMGSDPFLFAEPFSMVCFNPRSHMGSDVLSCLHGNHFLGFNPRSHMGSDRLFFALWLARALFQSTLPHGERQDAAKRNGGVVWFQSTLPHGERLSYSTMIQPLSSFNPRSHMGSDVTTNTNLLRGLGFNPRSHMGSDQSEDESINQNKKFQSTLPHGERHVGQGYGTLTQNVSIHAPTWGATKHIWKRANIFPFQSTLPHGERLHFWQIDI